MSRDRARGRAQIVDALGGLVPRYLAGLLKDLRGGLQFRALGQRRLVHRRHLTIALEHGVDGFNGGIGAQGHQPIVNILHVGVVGDGKRLAENDATGVDVLVQEEGGYAGLGLTVDDGPVDGAAPRYWGSRAACTLNVPKRGIDHTTSGNMRNATTTCKSA